MITKNINGHTVEIRENKKGNTRDYPVALFVDGVFINTYTDADGALTSAQSYCDSEPVSKTDNGIINDLKRLERTGDVDSTSSQKLREAAARVADKICATVAHTVEARRVELPRGYSVCSEYYQDTFKLMLKVHDLPEFLNVRCNARLSNVQQFATDIATGLLGEIAAWLEERAQANEQATAELEKAE